MHAMLFWTLLAALFASAAAISLVAVFWRHLVLDFTLGAMLPDRGFGQDKIEDYTRRSRALFLKSLAGPVGMLAVVIIAAVVHRSFGVEVGLLVPAAGLLALAIKPLIQHRRLEKEFARESGLSPGECDEEAREAA